MQNSKALIVGMIYMIGFSTSAAHAEGSGSGSHGGTGIICGEQIELAEFREVRLRPGLAAKIKIVQSSDSVDQQIQRAMENLSAVNAEVGKKVSSYVDEIRKSALPIASYDWGFSNDVNFYPLPSGCNLKTVVHYLADDMIEYRSDLYDQMTATDQAGLWIHEGVYRLNREYYGSQGTLATRRIVSALFAQNIDQALLAGLVYQHLLPATERGQLVELSTEQREKGGAVNGVVVDDDWSAAFESKTLQKFPPVEEALSIKLRVKGWLNEKFNVSYRVDISVGDLKQPILSIPGTYSGRLDEGGFAIQDQKIRFVDQSVRLFELGK